mgnify:CR=1 FL=1
MDDLAKWKVMIEEPLKVNYKGIDVYKLQQYGRKALHVAGVEYPGESLISKACGYNSTRYIHTVYQAMNLAFA